MTTTTRAIAVMVIDDSETIRRTARTVLEEAGFEVSTAEHGIDALAKLVDLEPDIIFADVVMPNLDGFQTVSLIRNNPGFADIPIVMLTSKGGVFDIAKGKFVGCNDYLVKPFAKDAIIQTISRHVRIQGVAS